MKEFIWLKETEILKLVVRRVDDRWDYLEPYIKAQGKEQVIKLVMDAVIEALPKTESDLIDTAITAYKAKLEVK